MTAALAFVLLTATTLPELTLKTQNGASYHLRAARGSLVLVHFWATWCGPCRRELPLLQRFADAHPGKVALVGIALDAQGWKTVLPLLRELNIRFPVALGSADLLRRFGLRAPLSPLPQTLIFNEHGERIGHIKSALDEKQRPLP